MRNGVYIEAQLSYVTILYDGQRGEPILPNLPTRSGRRGPSTRSQCATPNGLVVSDNVGVEGALTISSDR